MVTTEEPEKPSQETLPNTKFEGTNREFKAF
jgi:hypothetical protein